MTKRTHTLLLAPLAIAATLACSTTALFAQETVPAEAAPVAAPPPVITQPRAIVVPTFPQTATPDVFASTPETAAAGTTVQRSAARPVAAERSAPSTSVNAVAPAKTAKVAITPPVAPAAAPAPSDNTVPMPTPVPVAQAAPVAPAPSDTNALAFAGLAGLLALGGAGVFWARRRRGVETIDEPIYVDQSADSIAAVVAAPIIQPAPLIAEPASVATPTWFATQPTVAAMPTSATDRAGLIERMVAAEPDEANPFHTRKSRRHRARLLLQGMEARGEIAADGSAPAPQAPPTGYDWDKIQPYTPAQRDLVDA